MNDAAAAGAKPAGPRPVRGLVALWRDAPPRSRWSLVVLALVLALLPLAADRYLLTTLILILSLPTSGRPGTS